MEFWEWNCGMALGTWGIWGMELREWNWGVGGFGIIREKNGVIQKSRFSCIVEMRKIGFLQFQAKVARIPFKTSKNKKLSWFDLGRNRFFDFNMNFDAFFSFQQSKFHFVSIFLLNTY